MKASWVVITRGDRPNDLTRAIDSIRSVDPGGEVVLVCNGCATDPGLADRFVVSEENLGVPGGRNLGWKTASGDVVFFLDDDAWLGSGPITPVLEAFEDDPDLGIVSFRIEDPESGFTARRHVPRVGGSGIDRATAVTAFLGGACAIRRRTLTALDGFWSELFYSHEETDFSWRATDAGYGILYQPEVTVFHPAAEPGSRHPDTVYLSIRNRVLLARRDLPIPLGFIYVAVWLIIGLARARSGGDFFALWRGLGAGIRGSEAKRDPIRWATVWRLTRLGRPPII